MNGFEVLQDRKWIHENFLFSLSMQNKTLADWMDEYGESHRNITNKRIHYFCIPAIFFSIVGLLYSISLPWNIMKVPLTLAHPALALVIFYYTRFSNALTIGMAVFGLLCLTLCNLIQLSGFVLWQASLVIFIVAWIGQFAGHHIEGKKPSFLKDIQFLLIGPAWIMMQLFKAIGIR